MFLNFKKDKLESIRSGFAMLRDAFAYDASPDVDCKAECQEKIMKACPMIIEGTEGMFPYHIKINLCYEDKSIGTPIFGMAVYPDTPVVDKIVELVAMGGENSAKEISILWAKNKIWTIELDCRIFKDKYISLTPEELTALYLHELGHITSSNSVPMRITNILQYEIAKGTMTNKAILRNKVFSGILKLPILNTCVMDNDKNALVEEIRADKFAVKAGYKKDLISALNKFQNCAEFKRGVSTSKAMKSMSLFTIDAAEQFAQRRTALLEATLEKMMEGCCSTILTEAVKDVYNQFFYNDNTTSVTKDRKLDYLYECAENSVEEFYANEFFGLGKQKLKRIDPAQIDYIQLKMQSIESDNDKLMLVSYARSKIDICDFYLSILDNPVKAKKYDVPYSREELLNIKDRLERMVTDIIAYRIPNRLTSNILVAWPDGYDG